jgi:glucose/arabinose dehydrogenase/PKD repeat protein
VVGFLLAAVLAFPAHGSAAPPSGFQETTAFSALSSPTVVRFANDGRVFVAEQGGLIKVYDSLSDPTPTVFANLTTQTQAFWDRGLLGMALDPQFPTRPYIYVSYTYDAAIGGTAPRWGDTCPTPPGATGDGCVVSGRLSKLTASGNVMTGEQVLIEDWCQQYPSHSIGAVQFGQDGALYMSGGDGASFNFADWGQDGSPLNPCGDPPTGVGGSQTVPTAEGGALRSQDLRTSGDPVNLNGAVIRVNPDTGAAMLNNPLIANSDPNARRIVAYGLRNPFRFTLRPGTNEVWIGDVGWSNWEEINRVVDPLAGVTNFGWPCREGPNEQSGYRDLNICAGLRAQPSATTGPLLTYAHSAKVAGESCPTGGSSISGLEFYDGGTFPSSYNGALFFADYSRNCIWVMFAGANGVPNPATTTPFDTPAAGPVHLEVGPGGDLFYADLTGGTIRRIHYISANRPPTAVATADVTSGSPPLTVHFDGRGSSDPDAGDTLSYAWDLDGDGAFDDSTSATPTQVYSTAGTTQVRLRVTDGGGASDTSAPIAIVTDPNDPPSAAIGSPTSATRWKVGDTIAFSGSATDAEDGAVPAASLTWTLDLIHCAVSNPNSCHAHHVQDWNGVASGSFAAPDHEYPSRLELTLTAVDSRGLSDTETLRLDPDTVQLSFDTVPSGMQLSVASQTEAAPFTRTVIKRSTTSVTAPSPQVLGSDSYLFSSWSDGGAGTHTITAGDTAATYTARFDRDTGAPVPGMVAAYGFDEGAGLTAGDRSSLGNTGTLSGATWALAGRFGGAVSFDGVNDWVSVADAASLDLTTGMTLEAWVRPTAAGSSWRTVALKEASGNLAYALYSNEGADRPSGHVNVSGDKDTRGTAAVPLNNWTHLATTYDGATLRLFVNGAQVSSRALPGSILQTTGAFRIGGNGVWPEWFTGLIDELRVYNRALTAAELQADMTKPVSGPAQPPPQDTTPPTQPQNLVATGTLGRANLTWSASTDAVGVTGYDVHRSATSGFSPSAANRIAQITGTTYADSISPGTWYYRVVARDAAGNLSTPSAQAQAVVTSDTTAPIVSITAPAGGATVSNVINVTASASDDVGVLGVQMRLDGQSLGAEDTTAPYEASWDTRTASAGSHTLTAVARDAAGNTQTSAPVTVTVNNTTPPPTGLVAAYGFDEGAGLTAGDRSSLGNTGTLSGATWALAGRFGGAVSFDGVNDWVSVADAASLDLTTGMTLEAWVRPAAAGSSWRTVALKETSGNLAYALYSNEGANRPSGHVNVSGDKDTRGTAAVALNAWTHLATTYDGATLRLFVNGAQVSSRALPGSILASSSPFRIGGNGVWPEWFQGLIDELRVYNRALTATELQSDMNRPVGP